MGTISQRSTVDVPRDRVFAYVNDYQNVPKFMFGVTRFAPTAEKTSGIGSTFDVAMDLGPKTLKSTVETVEWVENEFIRLESIKGFSANTTWRFADDGDGTAVAVEFEYTLPGGIAGRALGAVIEPLLGQAIRQTEANLSKQVSELA